MAKLTIDKLDVHGKTVLVRVDFNVPLADGAVADDTRIRAALPTIRHLMDRQAKTVLMSHLGRPKGKADPALSLRPIAAKLRELLGKPVEFCETVVGESAGNMAGKLEPGAVMLLENLRYHEAEEKNDPDFAKRLAELGELYVSDAFGTVHRAHASTEGVARLFDRAAAGFLIAKELDFLGRVMDAPESPFVAIVGGAKVGDKIAVIRSLLQRADVVLIGGGMAYTFLKAMGRQVGTSLLDEPHLGLAGELLAEAKSQGKAVLLPVDHLVAGAFDKGAAAEPAAADIPDEMMGLDIGPLTTAAFQAEIAKANMVIWNGPMGVFEFPAFREGTFAIARSVAECGGTTIVGGGDSVAAVNQAGVAGRIDHVSTGGGASLEFLEGKTLPGIAALTDA